MTYFEDWTWLQANFVGNLLRFVWDPETNQPVSIIFVGRPLNNKTAVFCSGKTLADIRIVAEKRLMEITR
ncbi:MAG: hypothetical protein AABY07_02885 [Nanoarchaeota archaeon]